MNRKLIFYSLVIAVLTYIANWGIQLTFYYFTITKDPLAFNGFKTLLNYQTGIVGDSLLLPLMNSLIFYILVSLRLKAGQLPIWRIAFVSLGSDFLIHFLQGALQITNWSMPKPFQWSFVSFWHMITLFFQLFLVFLFIYCIFHYNKQINLNKKLNLLALLAALLLLAFLALFIYDYHWLFEFQ